MKKLLLSFAIVAAFLTSCDNGKKKTVETKEAEKVENIADLNNVNLESSTITWKGEKPTGSHNGVISLKSGSLLVADGEIKGGEFVIDMSSIKNEDLDAETGAKLVGHLTSPDFFDVPKYPTSKFVITSVEKKGENLNVTGNLTIKDVTKSITIPASMTSDSGIVTFTSDKFMIDRADFNVKYGSKSFFDNLKDKYINDEMEMSFVVVTK